jgi:pimeloyl-ACP methyl ester carboxylesterase
VNDVRAIAGALGIERLAVWGYSGGGPHALACAALLPDLVSAVATFASVAPFDAPGLDYFTGMGEANADDIRLLLEDPEAARAKNAKDRDAILQVTPEALVEAWASLVSPADAAVLTEDLALFVVTCISRTVSPQGTRAGGTMDSRGLPLGDSRSTPSGCRSRSGTGRRTSSSHSNTANGCRSTSPVQKRT